jgi:hypothetical protein
MTMSPKKTVSAVVAVILLSLLLAGAYTKATSAGTAVPLGIEIALKKTFYVPAGNTTKIVIRVPITDGTSQGGEQISAIRLEPRMEGDQVRVIVSALIGEPDDVRSCRDFDGLKAKPVGSYLANLGDEVSLVELRDFGVSFGPEPLTFNVVPKRVLSPVPNLPPGGCECGSCDLTNCCANPGMCLGCGSCGYVCCGGG